MGLIGNMIVLGRPAILCHVKIRRPHHQSFFSHRLLQEHHIISFVHSSSAFVRVIVPPISPVMIMTLCLSPRLVNPLLMYHVICGQGIISHQLVWD